MRTVDEVIANKEKYRVTLEKTNEALLTYVDELKQMKRLLFDNASGNGDILEAEE